MDMDEFVSWSPRNHRRSITSGRLTRDKNGNTIINEFGESSNHGMIVLGIVLGLLLLFMVSNYLVYRYAQRNFASQMKKKKKPVSKKKMKRERLRQGISAPGE
ncbi:unnamed protein product [Linum tenue]|uniref:DNA-binding protein S1FA-like n=1 Tax=Linum tenue TaxID=586396 RepID=A0AAV0Q9X8_9ROSI|nr:unnamed protein product [Linum tenue]